MKNTWIIDEMISVYRETGKSYTFETVKRWISEMRDNEKDSGVYGKVFEMAVKTYVNGHRGNWNKVSAKGKTDMKSKGVTYEIKSNCGELNPSIIKNDYIIYTYDNQLDCLNPWNARVIPTDDFLAIVDACGLRRKKVSTNGQLKESIQSYKNSKRKSALWITAVDKYPTLKEWLA